MNKTKIKLSSGMESEDIKKKVHLCTQAMYRQRKTQVLFIYILDR